MSASHAGTKHILDRYVDSYSLETMPLSERFGVGHWIDNDRLICTVLPRESESGGRGLAAAPTNVVLVDTLAKSVKVVAEGAAVIQFDGRTREAYIGEARTDRATPVRRIQIEANGAVSETARYAPGQAFPDLNPEVPTDKNAIYKTLPRAHAGYFVKDRATQSTQEILLNDIPVLTTWIRPGSTDLHLPIRFDEIGNVRYIEYLNKYLLNTRDPHRNSHTNSRYHKTWTRPYEVTPFRLLSEAGQISEIPYPQVLTSYGLGDFDEFLLTRAGSVITYLRDHDSAAYLIKDSQLYRVRSGKRLIGFRVDSLSMEGADQFTLSPDGCKIAYRHYLVNVMAAKAYTPRFLTIANVCGEDQ